MTTPPERDSLFAQFLDVDPADMNTIHRLILGVAGLVGLVLSVPPASVSAEVDLARQTSMRGTLPTLLDPSSLIDAERRGLLSNASVDESMARLGYSPAAHHALEQLAEQLLGPAEVLDLWRRKAITEEERDERLERIGWKGDEIAGLVELARFKPPVSDVLAFAVREVFRPEVRERFQLDAEFPGDDPATGARLMSMFESVGIDETLARDYWAAHWILPSVQQVFEMLHRTEETGVTEADLDSLLVAADVMLRWREPLKAIAFNPITRVDIRRWHALGLLTTEELTERYRRVGFSPDDAELMTEFTVRFNARSEENALEPFRNPLRTRATTLWRRGLLSTAELRETFVDLGFPEDQAEAFVTAAAFEREADHSQDILRRVEPLFVRGFWTEEEAIGRLRDLGFEETELRVTLDDWTLARELREETALERQERDLSKSDVLGAFLDQLIPRLDAEAFLRQLGFDEDEARVLLDRQELKQGRESRTRAERGARALFMAGRADQDATVSTLGEADITPARITLLLLQWQAERAARTPELTTAQVQKAFKARLLTSEEAAARLDDKGYTQADRDILLSLAGEPEGVTEEGG